MQIRRATAQLRLAQFSRAKAVFQGAGKVTYLSYQLSAKLKAPTHAECADLFEKYQNQVVAGLLDIERITQQVDMLRAWHSNEHYKVVVQVCTEAMTIAPHCRAFIVARANAKCALKQFDECNADICSYVLDTHESILQSNAHMNARFPVEKNLIGWADVGGSFVFNNPATVNFMLCMGSDLAQVYVTTLKGISVIRHDSEAVRSWMCSLMALLRNTLTGNCNVHCSHKLHDTFGNSFNRTRDGHNMDLGVRGLGWAFGV